MRSHGIGTNRPCAVCGLELSTVDPEIVCSSCVSGGEDRPRGHRWRLVAARRAKDEIEQGKRNEQERRTR